MLTGMQLFSSATKIELADFGAEFAAFSSTAKRLEVLPAYNVLEERGALDAFRRGAIIDPAFNAGWHSILDAAAVRGASIERIRVLPDRPIEYVEFEIIHGYVPNQAHGERCSFVSQKGFSSVVGIDGIAIDFWLFDEERAYIMLYDSRGSFLGTMKAELPATKHLRDIYASLLPYARSLEWTTEHYLAGSAQH